MPENVTINGEEYVPVQCLKPDSDSVGYPWCVGKKYLVRTVTHYLLGRLVGVGKYELVFVEAGWVADTGQLHQCLKTGDVNEFEPAASTSDEVILGRGGIIDAWPWPHQIIEVVK